MARQSRRFAVRFKGAGRAGGAADARQREAVPAISADRRYGMKRFCDR